MGRSFFTDHHCYHAKEIETLASRARAAGAEALATTAKDAVRMEGLVPDAPGLPILVLHIAVSFSNEDRFSQQLLEAAGRAA